MIPQIFQARPASELTYDQRVSKYFRLTASQQTPQAHMAGLLSVFLKRGRRVSPADLDTVAWLSENLPAYSRYIAFELDCDSPVRRAEVWGAVLHTYGPAVAS